MIISIQRNTSLNRAPIHAIRATETRWPLADIPGSVLAALSDGVLVFDLSGNLLWQNGAATRLVQSNPGAHGSAIWNSFWPRAVQPIADAAFSAARITGAATFDADMGAPDHLALSVRLTFDLSEGRIIAQCQDMTKQVREREALRWQADHDALTGALRRAAFVEALERHPAGPKPNEGPAIAVVVIDVDGLKQINQLSGKNAGDRILATVAERLRTIAQPGDLLGRIDGDEFAIARPTSQDGCVLEAEFRALLPELTRPVACGDSLLFFSLGIGIASSPGRSASGLDLLRDANTALAEAKRRGPARVACFSGEMRTALQQHATVLKLARTALDERQIEPFYQPKVDLRTNRVIGFEALLRWRSRRGTIQSAGSLGRAWDDPDLSARLGEVMFHAVLNDVKKWTADGVRLPVSINVSEADFRRDDFPDMFLKLVSSAGIDPSRIEIEITENVFLGHASWNAERVLSALKEAGIRISLDDFGTGYASLVHLKNYPIDIIKIDQQFVRGLETCPGDLAIVRTMISLGRNLGLDVIAEGIETDAVAQILRSMKCDFGQGYAFWPALPAHEALKLAQGRAH